ncbi:MAG: TlpA disulfide reductase family protein [Bryobacteraceae bacterium]
MARVVAIALVSLAPVFAQELPRQAPEEIIHFTGGKTAKVSDYEGKVVLVAFILTGCSHCQHTVGILNGIQTDLGKRGLQIVGLAVNEDAPARLAQFYDKFKPTFPVGYCSAGDLPGFLQPPPGQRPLAPLLAFLDRKGMIRFEITGSDPNFFNDQEGDHIRAEVLKLLAEPGPSHARKARP